MAKQLLFDEKCRGKILNGVETLSKAVKTTLGPKGRNVVFGEKGRLPTITKDGVSVAKQIELLDPFEDMGAQMVKEVSSQTSDVAGDGTSTSVVLAESIYKQGLKRVAAGFNPMGIKRGIDKAVTELSVRLSEVSVPVENKEQITQIATISANSDKVIGNIIADAMDQVGNDGTITIDDAKSFVTTLTLTEGLQFDSGFVTRHFVTNQETQTVEFENCYFLLCEKKLSRLSEIVDVLQELAKTGQKLVVIAEDVDGEALSSLVMNKVRGSMEVVAIKTPGFGDNRNNMLQDIAVVTGAKVVGDGSGLEFANLTMEDLGVAKSLYCSQTETIIVADSNNEALEERVTLIKNQIESASSEYDKEKLQERLSKLSGGIAVIGVGASTETELKEKKARVEDALHATRAAVEEGIVAGGGSALLQALELANFNFDDEDEEAGIAIVKDAIKAPILQISKNGGYKEDVVLNTVQKHIKNNDDITGFDAKCGGYVNMIDDGIIDPAKVTRSALKNAASVSGLLLTTECIIAPIDDDGLNDLAIANSMM